MVQAAINQVCMMEGFIVGQQGTCVEAFMGFN